MNMPFLTSSLFSVSSVISVISVVNLLFNSSKKMTAARGLIAQPPGPVLHKYKTGVVVTVLIGIIPTSLSTNELQIGCSSKKVFQSILIKPLNQPLDLLLHSSASFCMLSTKYRVFAFAERFAPFNTYPNAPPDPIYHHLDKLITEIIQISEPQMLAPISITDQLPPRVAPHVQIQFHIPTNRPNPRPNRRTPQKPNRNHVPRRSPRRPQKTPLSRTHRRHTHLRHRIRLRTIPPQPPHHPSTKKTSRRRTRLITPGNRTIRNLRHRRPPRHRRHTPHRIALDPLSPLEICLPRSLQTRTPRRLPTHPLLRHPHRPVHALPLLRHPPRHPLILHRLRLKSLRKPNSPHRTHPRRHRHPHDPNLRS